jgi:3-hydroxybutyryl-CoA dehydrogenase
MSERMKLGHDTVSRVLKRVNFVNDFDNNIDWIVECLEEDFRIKSDRTDYGAISTICEFLKEHGKIPVKVPDVHGFIVNRILFAALFQAIELLDAQPVTAHEIDTCMKEGCSWPMGPLALADYIGMDVCESIMKSLTQDTTFPYRNIPQALQRLLGNGRLGRKNRKGFFNYD